MDELILHQMTTEALEDRADALEMELECTRALLRARVKQEESRKTVARLVAAIGEDERQLSPV